MYRNPLFKVCKNSTQISASYVNRNIISPKKNLENKMEEKNSTNCLRTQKILRAKKCRSIIWHAYTPPGLGSSIPLQKIGSRDKIQ